VRRSVVTLAILLAAACSRERPAATSTAATAPSAAVSDDTPRDGGTIVRRLDTDIATVNPVIPSSRYDRYVMNYIFTPLVQLNKAMQPIPGLAESWTISDDGLVYTFKLDEKATFSDGKPVRASDVLFTLRKIVDPASEAIQIAGAFEYLDLAKSKVIDDHTVEVAFKQPLASQLIRFNDVLTIPEHVYSKGEFRNDYNFTAVGSGPYRLVKRAEGREIVLERRPDFWSERPHIQTVIFKIIDDHVTAWNALKRGDIDETIVASDTWQREHNNPELTSYIDFRRFYTLNYNFIAWNNRHELLRDRDIRRALTMCVPVEAMVQDLYHGTARLMSGPFTPDDWAFNPRVEPVRFNVEEAKRIFASKGWRDTDKDGILEKNGRKFSLEFVVMSGSATTQQVAQMVQSEMKKAGVNMNLALLDGATAIQRIVSGNYQVAYLGMDLDPDPDPFAMYHSSQIPARGQNFLYYNNPEADRLIEQGRRELDLGKRKELYWQLHETMAADQPAAWTLQVSAKWAFNKRVRGVETSNGLGLFSWYPGELGWWLASDKRR
jgi:peptide/nickel transport system substrate-binding protein